MIDKRLEIDQEEAAGGEWEAEGGGRGVDGVGGDIEGRSACGIRPFFTSLTGH